MKTLTQSPEQLLLAHLQAIGSGDMDALMQHYTEESVFITPNGSFKGLSAIKAEFINLLPALPPGANFNPIKQITHGNNILLIWSAESTAAQIPFAVDTFVIENEKIMLQTFAGQVIAK